MLPRRVFTEEFKRDAVRLAKERGNTAEVARDLGIHEGVLSRWKKCLEAAPERPFPGKGNPQDADFALLPTITSEHPKWLKNFMAADSLYHDI